MDNVSGLEGLLLKAIQGSSASVSSVGSKGSSREEYKIRLKKKDLASVWQETEIL